MELGSGNIVSSHQAGKARVLASVSKILTFYYALNELGPDFKFSTNLSYTGAIKNGQLRGNLYLKGSGDPYLTAPHLLSMIHKLETLGVKSVEGDFILDDYSLPGSNRISPLGQEDQTDNPSYGALNTEFNRFSVWTKGNLTHPPLPELKISGKTNRPHGPKFIPANQTQGNEKWLRNTSAKVKLIEELPVKDATAFTGNYFRFLAERMGITVPLGKRGKTPSNTRPIVEHLSLPLYRLVSLGFEYSNNLIAETILLTASKQSSLKEGANVATNWLKKKHPQVGWAPFSMANGSGLTLGNVMPPQSMAKFLREISSEDIQGRSFWSFFSINAHSGSLARRLKHPSFAFRVFGKSGALYYVNNLAGYLIASSGKRYSFAIFSTDTKARQSLSTNNSAQTKRLRAQSRDWHQKSGQAIEELLAEWIRKF